MLLMGGLRWPVRGRRECRRCSCAHVEEGDCPGCVSRGPSCIALYVDSIGGAELQSGAEATAVTVGQAQVCAQRLAQLLGDG